MNKLTTLVLTFAISPAVFAEGSPWLPGVGDVTISSVGTTGSTDEFFIGDTSTDLGGDLEGTFLWISGSYGLTDSLAFDVRTGYARSTFETNPIDQEDFADTSIGVTYRFINEFEASGVVPTLSARVGFTFGGDYETDLIDAIGDGGSGFDLSLLLGKSINEFFSVSGDLSFRQRDNDISDAFQYVINGFFATPLPGLGFKLGLGGIRTDSDIDIGGPGFGVEQFPQTDRDTDVAIAGVNYGFNSGIGLGLSRVMLLDGRNVADTDITTLSLSYSF